MFQLLPLTRVKVALKHQVNFYINNLRGKEGEKHGLELFLKYF